MLTSVSEAKKSKNEIVYKIYCGLENKKKRMHSSRMRTGRSLTVCCSRGGGGGCLLWGGAWSGGGLVPGGVCSQGGVPGPGGGVGGVSQHALRQTPSPPVDRILDTRL